MRYLQMVAVSLAILLLTVAGYSLVGNVGLRGTVVATAVLNAKGLAAIGAFMAMMGFERGDYMRKAWAATLAYAVAFIEADLWMLLVGPYLGPEATGIGRGVLVIACNVFSVASMVLFARAATVSGLFATSSRGRRLLVMLPAAVVAVLVAGAPAWSHAMRFVHGDLASLAFVTSSVGDIATFTLIAPLVVTVIRLRGSPLRWTFVFIAAGNFCWLFYDLTELFWSAAPGTVLANVQDAWRILACLYVFAAAVAQRMALTVSRPELRRPSVSSAAA